jgi:hypothetical protein
MVQAEDRQDDAAVGRHERGQAADSTVASAAAAAASIVIVAIYNLEKRCC